jgi:hypothetical protein
MTGGFTNSQEAAIAAVINLADATTRGEIAAAINSALGPPGYVPYSDAAVLAAIGQALVRYGG